MKQQQKKIILEIKNLNCFYRSNENVLHGLSNLSLTIYEGETIGILGAENSGKSTLLKVLTGLIPFTSGEIILLGKKITPRFLWDKSNLNWYKRKIQMIFQDPGNNYDSIKKIEKAITKTIKKIERTRQEQELEDRYDIKSQVDLTKIEDTIKNSDKFLLPIRIKSEYLRIRNNLISEIGELQNKYIGIDLNLSKSKRVSKAKELLYQQELDYIRLVYSRRQYLKSEQQRIIKLYGFVQDKLLKLQEENNSNLNTSSDNLTEKEFLEFLDIKKKESKTNMFVKDFLNLKDVIKFSDQEHKDIGTILQPATKISYKLIVSSLLKLVSIIESISEENTKNPKVEAFLNKWNSKILSIKNWSQDKIEVTNFYFHKVKEIFNLIAKIKDKISENIKEAEYTNIKLLENFDNLNLIDGLNFEQEKIILKAFLDIYKEALLKISSDSQELKNIFLTSSIQGTKIFFEKANEYLNSWMKLELRLATKLQKSIVNIIEKNGHEIRANFRARVRELTSDTENILDVTQETLDNNPELAEKIKNLHNLDKKFNEDIEKLKNYKFINWMHPKRNFYRAKTIFNREINARVTSFFKKLIPVDTPEETRKIIESNLEHFGINIDKIRNQEKQLTSTQLQKIIIAVSLLMKAAIFLDYKTDKEPVSENKIKILNLIKAIISDKQLGILIVTNDLDYIKKVTDRVYVIKKGRIVEFGKTSEVLEKPMHPHTKKLIKHNPKELALLEENSIEKYLSHLDQFFSLPKVIKVDDSQFYYLSERKIDDQEKI